jgi:hypothetical protein
MLYDTALRFGRLRWYRYRLLFNNISIMKETIAVGARGMVYVGTVAGLRATLEASREARRRRAMAWYASRLPEAWRVKDKAMRAI